jgi:hypothetical protein
VDFLWVAGEEAKRCKCMVNWKKICAPKKLGGLGIKDIQCISRTLRTCLEWLSWAEIDRLWKGTNTPFDATNKDLFSACTVVTVGNGQIYNIALQKKNEVIIIILGKHK